MVLTCFQMETQFEKSLSFQKTFLLADLHLEMVLEIFFCYLKNANIQFAKKNLI